MTATEIGTDSAATLYAQGESIRTTVEKLLPLLTDVTERVQPLDSRLTNVESILVEVLSQLQKIDVTTVQIGDKAIEINERSISSAGKLEAVHLANGEFMTQLKVTQITLDTFTGWFVPILDDFRETAILPTMNRIDGKVSELLASHMHIKGLTESLMDKASPLLEKIEKSPILKMLGVNTND